MFESIVCNITNLKKLNKLEIDEINQIRVHYSDIPKDYINFLLDVGFGNLGELQIYEGPIPSKSIYSAHENLEHIILIGDDFQGYCFGFDIKDNYRLVEVSPSGEVDNTIEESFIELLEGYFLN